MKHLAVFLLGLWSVLLLAGCAGDSKEEMFAEGKRLYEEENYQGAIVLFKNILEEDPNFAEARLELGRAYLQERRFDQAERELSKYAKTNPYDDSARIELARLDLMQGRPDKAVAALKGLVAASPDSAEGFELLGVAYGAQGNLDLAVGALEKALELEPGRESSLVGLGRVHMVRGEPGEARKAVGRLLESDPDSRNGLHLLAIIEYRENNVEAMYDAYEKLATAHPEDAFARYMTGKRYVARGDFDAVAKIADKLMADKPRLPFGFKLKGLERYFRRDYPGATTSFQETLKRRPDAETYFFLGMSHYANGNPETAISNLQQAAEMAPAFAKPREMLSLILLKQRRTEEAAREAEKAHELNPESVVARYLKADAHLAQGELDKAIQDYESVIELRPGAYSAHMKKGMAHLASGEEEKMEGALMDAMEAAPENIRPRITLASFYLSKGEREKTSQVLEEGLNGSRSDAPLYLLLARMQMLENNKDVALELLGKAKQADAEFLPAYFELAKIYMAGNEAGKAVAEYDGILSINPKATKAWLEKGLALEVQGKNAEAEKCFAEAVTHGTARVVAVIAGLKARKGEMGETLAALNEGLAKWPQDQKLLSMKVHTLLALGRAEEALEVCRTIAEINPVTGNELLIDTYLRMGRLDEALETAKAYMERFPQDYRPYLALAKIYRIRKERGNERAILERGIGVCGSLPPLLVELGNHYVARGEMRKGLNYYESAVNRDQRYVPAYVVQGVTYQRMGENGKAIEMYRKVLSLSQKEVLALNNLAMLYADSPDTADDALRLAYAAYLLEPRNPNILDTFGYTLLKNGRPGEAATVLEKAVALAQDSSEIRYHLALAYHGKGDNGMAAEELRRSLEKPDFADADEARKLLGKLSGG